MKSILFATTALIATAGVAAAEITIGGSARFGLAYNEANDTSTRVEQRMRINITGIATTDAGVKFEGRFRLESNEDANSAISGKGPGAAGFAVSYEGLRVDVGNVSDVFDSGDVINYYGYGIGLTALVEHNTPWYGTDAGNTIGGFGAGGADMTTLKARYTAGGFTVAASYSETKAVAADVTIITHTGATPSTETITNAEAVAATEEFQIGAGYDFNGTTFGAAYGDDDVAGDYWAATVSGDFGQFGYAVMIGDADSFDDMHIGASMNYEISSATSIQALIADGANDDDATYGVGFKHSLGGGVTLKGGVASDNGNTLADLGVALSF
ncbi:porin [Parasedimentitalea psychrophila]|uniref:Porin n=1 Tax=Parasedimentitalea psychrophila TaxID=2997337 RepID=A0A9Y2L287_9RHOB|nr:porin [Parasedimentitalea psychrophila]WIY26983.1 porin [Parasedimentitalea psychrophila]